MAYTPELSLRGSATLRRLAWFLNKPMTKTLEMVMELVAIQTTNAKSGAVCASCRDATKCASCGFNPTQRRR